MVIGQGLRLAVIGVALGLAGAYAVSRVFSALLFETRPTDFGSYVIATVALTVSAMVASLIPARRATRVDPMIALRAE